MFQKAHCLSSRGRVGFLQSVLLLLLLPTAQREVETHVVALKGSSVSREQINLLVVRQFMTENGYCLVQVLPTAGGFVFAQVVMAPQGSGTLP